MEDIERRVRREVRTMTRRELITKDRSPGRELPEPPVPSGPPALAPDSRPISPTKI